MLTISATLKAAKREMRRSEPKTRSRGLPPELILIDFLCKRWGEWSRSRLVSVGRTDKSVVQKMIEWHERGELPRETLYPGSPDDVPAGVLLIDGLLRRLPRPFYDVFMLEYLQTSMPREHKAATLRCKVIEYRARIKEMLWTLYGFIAVME